MATNLQLVYMMELTVQWDEGMEAVFVSKNAKYVYLEAEHYQAGWRVVTYGGNWMLRGNIHPVAPEAPKGSRLVRKALKEQAEEAEQKCFWLWLQRMNKIGIIIILLLIRIRIITIITIMTTIIIILIIITRIYIAPFTNPRSKGAMWLICFSIADGYVKRQPT